MLGDYLLMKTRTLLTQIFLETWTTRLIFLRCFPLNCLCLLQSLPIVRVWRMTAVVEGTRLLKVSKRTHISGSAYAADSGFGSKGRGIKSEILGCRPGKPLFIWVWTPVPFGAQPRPDVRCMCPGDMGRKLTPPGPLLLAPTFT